MATNQTRNWLGALVQRGVRLALVVPVLLSVSVANAWATPEINVTGNSRNIADGDTSSSVLDHTFFESVAHVSGTISRTFTIENTGTSTLTLGANAASLSGTHAADFTVTSQPATTVAASGSTSVTVEFDPSALGTRNATLSIANNDSDENPYDFALRGTGAGTPEINVTGNGQSIVDGDTTPQAADHTDFGSVDIGNGDIERTFAVQNIGDARLTVGHSSVSITGPDAADFSVFTHPFPFITGGSSATTRIRFDPSTVGTKSATVTILNDDVDESPYSFAVSGTATSAPEIEVRTRHGFQIPNGAAHVSYRVASLSFNEAFGEHTYTINNVGSDTLAISNVTITGTHAAEFSVVTPPAATVAAGGSTTFTLRFTQTTSGVRTANINITNNDSDEGAFTFGTTGFRFSGPDPDVSGQGLDIANGDTTPRPEDDTDFGSVNTASGFVEKSFTGINNGDSPMMISSITVTGAHASDFSVTTGTGFSPITVRFDPSADGLRTATVNIASDALVDNPFTFAIQGTGTSAAPEIGVSSSESGVVADGGTDAQGSEEAGAAKTVTYTVSNTGTDDLTLATATSSSLSNVAVNAISAPALTTVTPGNSTTFTVQYTPTIAGAFSFDLAFTNNDGDENPFNMTVSGTATGTPEIAVSSSESGAVTDGGTDAQGSEAAGSAKTVTYTVSNTGTDDLTLATATSSSLSNVSVNAIAAPGATTVTPGNSTTFTVQYTPTIAGAFSFDLAFTNNDGNENPYNISLSGTATGTPEIAVSSSESGAVADGGTDAQGNEPAGTAKTVTYTMSNTGTDDLTLATATSSSLSNVTVNAISAPGAATVTPGNSTTFTVQYTPTLAGAFSFDLAFTNNDGDENPYNMTISGTATGAPEMNVLAGITTPIADNPSHDPASISGTRLDTTVGGSSSNLFTIENTGTGPLNLGANAVSLSGVGAADFSVSQQPATSVAPGNSTTFRILFSASVAGLQGPINVAISSDDADENPYNFRVQGLGREIEIDVTGNGQAIADNPSHVPSTTDHTDFGSADISAGTTTRTFTVENNGVGFFLTLDPNAVSLSGAHAGDFSVTAQPATSVDVGLTTTFQITFDPSVAGVRGPVDVSVANSDPDEGPYNFRIQGTGTAAPEINVIGNGQTIVDGDASADATDHTDFGSADVTSGTVSRAFTIENTGSSVLTLGANAASLSGVNAGDFTVTAQPATSVAASGSTSVTVQFDPSALGARSATLSIVNDDGDEALYDFALTGTGAGMPEVAVSSSESGAVADGGTDAQGSEPAGSAKIVTYTVSNAGTDDLTLATATSSSLSNVTVNSISTPASTTVTPGNSTTFTVQYTPTIAGFFSFDLTFINNDGDENPYNMSVSGNVSGAPEINFVGNGVGIVDGDTTPAEADHTDFSSADITSGTVSRSFTIQNTGTDVLTLGANAASLSGANAGDFTVTTQPAASVAPGGVTAVTVQFDPSAPGARGATLTIANDDGDENPYDFALAGEGISGGTITIVQNITGADVSVGFSSATPALNFTLNSVSGTARLSQQGVPAGTHALIAEDLSSVGYGVSSISCDDTDSGGDVVSRSATINLLSGEHVTCVFETIDTRGPTTQMIADFLGARNRLLLSNQPGGDRRINRLKGGSGVSGGDSFQAFGHSLRSPIPVDVAVNDDSFSFATSLKRVMAAGGEVALSAKDNEEEVLPLDIWIEGRASRFIDGTSGGGSFGLLSFGVDYLVEPDLLIGFMGQVDRFKQDFSTPGAEIEGRGWLAGPYVTFKLDEHLYLDVLGAWGRSDNDISPFGSYTDSFETDRWLVSSTLTGQFDMGNWDLRPSYGLQVFHERQFAYTDNLGVRIPEQSLSQGDMRLGPKIAYTHMFEDGSSLRPNGGFEGVYAFGERNTFSAGSFAAETQGLTGQVNGGLEYETQGGLALALSADYGGIGSTAKSFGLSINLSMPLN